MSFSKLVVSNLIPKEVIKNLNFSFREIKNNFAVDLTLSDNPNARIRYETYINEKDDWVYVHDGEKWFRYHHALKRGVSEAEIKAVTDRVSRLERIITSGVLTGPRGDKGDKGDKGIIGPPGAPGPDADGEGTGSEDMRETTPEGFMLWGRDSHEFLSERSVYSPTRSDFSIYEYTVTIPNPTLSLRLTPGDQVRLVVTMTIEGQSPVTSRFIGTIARPGLNPYFSDQKTIKNGSRAVRLGIDLRPLQGKYVFDVRVGRQGTGSQAPKMKIDTAIYFKDNDHFDVDETVEYVNVTRPIGFGRNQRDLPNYFDRNFFPNNDDLNDDIDIGDQMRFEFNITTSKGTFSVARETRMIASPDIFRGKRFGYCSLTGRVYDNDNNRIGAYSILRGEIGLRVGFQIRYQNNLSERIMFNHIIRLKNN